MAGLIPFGHIMGQQRIWQSLFSRHARASNIFLCMILLQIGCILAQNCDESSAFIVRKNGQEFLRINSSTEFYACGVNLCSQSQPQQLLLSSSGEIRYTIIMHNYLEIYFYFEKHFAGKFRAVARCEPYK